jgi:hypothetical protein
MSSDSPSPTSTHAAMAGSARKARRASPQLLKDAAHQYGMSELEVPPGPAPYAHPFFLGCIRIYGIDVLRAHTNDCAPQRRLGSPPT